MLKGRSFHGMPSVIYVRFGSLYPGSFIHKQLSGILTSELEGNSQCNGKMALPYLTPEPLDVVFYKVSVAISSSGN